MKIHNNSCYLCGNNTPQILFPAFYKSHMCPLENIVICKQCGLVYKHPIVLESEVVHYMQKDHWDDPYFDTKLSGTAEYVHSVIDKNRDKIKTIVDVGAAAGHLLFHLGKHFKNSTLIGVEPSKYACDAAKEKNADIIMVNGTLENFESKDGSIDIVTAIGVDYLFFDHTEALRKIHSMLKKGGYLYIERNVFLNSRAYRSTAIDTVADLFGRNSMMKTWFMKDQMEIQLQKFFTIEKTNEFVANVVKGHKNIHYGWLCKKAEINEKIDIPNSYEANLAYITKMQRHK